MHFAINKRVWKASTYQINMFWVFKRNASDEEDLVGVWKQTLDTLSDSLELFSTMWFLLRQWSLLASSFYLRYKRSIRRTSETTAVLFLLSSFSDKSVRFKTVAWRLKRKSRPLGGQRQVWTEPRISCVSFVSFIKKICQVEKGAVCRKDKKCCLVLCEIAAFRQSYETFYDSPFTTTFFPT